MAEVQYGNNDRYQGQFDLGGSIANDEGYTARLTGLLAAAQTADAALIVGPLSYVGLMVPHAGPAARLTRAGGAAMLGMLVTKISDWLGPNPIFLYQIPASLIGGPYLMLLMFRR